MPADALAGDTLRTGEALVALGPEAFARVVNGQVHPQPKKNAVYGAIVGRLLVGDAEQVDALARLAESQPARAECDVVGRGGGWRDRVSPWGWRLEKDEVGTGAGRR
jgi:hypothetical protein